MRTERGKRSVESVSVYLHISEVNTVIILGILGDDHSVMSLSSSILSATSVPSLILAEPIEHPGEHRLQHIVTDTMMYLLVPPNCTLHALISSTEFSVTYAPERYTAPTVTGAIIVIGSNSTSVCPCAFDGT